MAAALVGTVGTVATGTSGASIAPAFGTGENRTAGNLLLLWVATGASTSLPAAPTGWSVGLQQAAASGTTASLFYRVADGTEASTVTVAAVTSTILQGQVAEFSGLASTSPVDQTASVTGTTTPQVATAASADVAAGELVVCCAGVRHNASVTDSAGSTLNNGATANDTTNNATSTNNHYCFTYGITTGNSSADSDSLAASATNLQTIALVLVSFALAAATSPQTVRPDADITTTNWSTTPLFSKVNDSSDATVITTSTWA